MIHTCIDAQLVISGPGFCNAVVNLYAEVWGVE